MSFHLKEAHRECGWLVVPARIVRRMRSRTDGGNRKRAGKKRKKKERGKRDESCCLGLSLQHNGAVGPWTNPTTGIHLYGWAGTLLVCGAG